MNSYVDRTRLALRFVNIGIALRGYLNASYCPQNPGNSTKRRARRLDGQYNDNVLMALIDDNHAV